MRAWIKEQWGKETVRCIALFFTLMSAYVGTFWFLYFGLHNKSQQWPKDRAAALPGDIREMCLGSYPDSTAMCNRLGEQYDVTVVRAFFHPDLFSHYIAEHFAALSLTFACGIFTAASLVIISRKGWEHTHNYVLTFFIASTLATSFFGGYPQLASHTENVQDNEQLFLEHGNLAGEMRTFAVTQRGKAEDGQDTVEDLAEFIHYIDRKLAAMNHIPLEFDASAVNLGAEKFMELQPE
jgi:hypothetical protein